jgi:hypothetical protein
VRAGARGPYFGDRGHVSKIHAERFRGPDHPGQKQEEAQAMTSKRITG